MGLTVQKILQNGNLLNVHQLIRVALIDSFALTRHCLIAATSMIDEKISFTSFSSIRECITAQASDWDIIIYYAHEKALMERLINQEITALRQAFIEHPVIVLLDTQAPHSSIVRDVLRSGARGVISARTIDMATVPAAVRYVAAGGVVVPVEAILTDTPALAETTLRLPQGMDLTSRQLNVFACLRQGKANKIIAHELQMSESTVKVHVRNIMRKMGATNRTQAVYNARQLGENSATTIRSGNWTKAPIVESPSNCPSSAVL
jgi:DNA-binding NarL/FixJ family response regulator